ncbi:rhomboid-domain-containing protein [Hortaea werneckii]|nr:rhomboid-domain-containing protein [Hortaea werneckii]
MNNVWTSIAFRAPCGHTRAKPLLQLFSGYARSQRARYSGQSSSRWGCIGRNQTHGYASTRWPYQNRLLSTSSPIRAASDRASSAAPRASPPKSDADARNTFTDSGLGEAPTVASHSEGLPVEEDGSGLTWRDYDPEGGMPLPEGDRSRSEINAIFGEQDMDADTGNYILSVMQWRRMSGALIDSGLDFPKRSRVSRDQALKGLQYIRTLTPRFDEQEAGQRWAEEESLRLQDEIRERSIKLGIYKRDPAEEVEEEDEMESQQGTEHGRERSKESALQAHRLEREAQWEKEQAELQARKEAEELATLHSQRGPLELGGGVQPSVALTTTGPDGVTINSGPRNAWLAPVERKPWVKYYEEQAQTIKTNLLPQITLWGRLGPSFLLLLAVLGLSTFLSENYTPPPASARLWPDTPPAVATLTTLTAFLGAAFILSRLPPLWGLLSKYFTLIPARPQAFSLLGATFRHDTFTHLATNILSLWLFGLMLHEDVGRGTFLAIFFSSSALGGFASLSYNVLRKQWMTYMFGSSGGVLGVVGASCALRPHGEVKVMGYEIPIAAWVFLAVFGAGEMLAAFKGWRTMVDHAGHLGGIVGGVGWGVHLTRKNAGEGDESVREG